MSTGSAQSSNGLNNEDPLGIDKLSVDYDYLLYKINDYVTTIQMETTTICKRQNELITEEIISQVVEKNIEGFKEILKKCEELENHFDKLDQIAVIAENFKVRLRQVVCDYRSLKN